MPQKTTSSWYRYFPASLTFCAGVALSILACAIVWDWEDRRQAYEFNARVSGIATSLEYRLRDRLEVILNLKDFLAASEQVELSSFRQFVRRSLKSHDSIRKLVWVPAAFIQEDTIASVNLQQIYTASAEHDASLEPAFDPRTVPGVWDGMKQAARAKDMVLLRNMTTSPGQTIPEMQLVAIQPVIRDNGVLKGFAIGLLNFTEIFQASLIDRGPRNLNIYLWKDRILEADTVPDTQDVKDLFLAFYDAPTQQLMDIPATSEPDELDPPNPLDPESLLVVCPVEFISESQTPSACHRQLQVGDRTWSIFVQPTRGYLANQKHWRAIATLIIGLLWTHIPVTYLLTSLGRTMQIEQLAKEREVQAEQLRGAFKQLEMQREKTERLLLNILPAPIADRLKHDPNIIADSFPDVTVLFADIVGFTKMATRIPPRELVWLLNEIFSAFDRLALEYGLEKIKTIGDAYMVVGGLPMPRADHVEAVARMALDMHAEIERFNTQHGESFSMRIGMHTGPVVAGVIGANKFNYDLWGDTVNIASRMESHGVPGSVQVTRIIYDRLRDRFDLEERGEIDVKGIGFMTTYLLKNPRSIAQSTDCTIDITESTNDSTNDSTNSNNSPSPSQTDSTDAAILSLPTAKLLRERE